MVNVKIKCEDVELQPYYASAQSAGFDLCAAEDIGIAPGEVALVPTGISLEIPEGYEVQIRPRSGMVFRYGVTVANAPGTIDADYRGEIKVLLHNINSPFTVTDFGVASSLGSGVVISKGERIAQGVLAKVEQAQFEYVKELSDTERGAGGFGSTGK